MYPVRLVIAGSLLCFDAIGVLASCSMLGMHDEVVLSL